VHWGSRHKRIDRVYVRCVSLSIVTECYLRLWAQALLAKV
jgi:hypothetical protein